LSPFLYRYKNLLIQILRQFLLIPNRSNKFMDIRAKYLISRFKQFCWDLIITWWFVSSELLNSLLQIKITRLRQYWSCCVYFSLPNSITPCTLNSWEKYFLHLTKLLSLYVTRPQFTSFTTSILVTGALFKVINAPIKISYIRVLNANFEFINFSFQIFLLFYWNV